MKLVGMIIPFWYELHTVVFAVYKPPIRFAIAKPNCPHFYRPPKRFAVVKTDHPNFYKLPTRYSVVMTDSPSFYKPPIRFAVVKTASLFAVVKRWTLRASTSHLHA